MGCGVARACASGCRGPGCASSRGSIRWTRLLAVKQIEYEIGRGRRDDAPAFLVPKNGCVELFLCALAVAVAVVQVEPTRASSSVVQLVP